MTHQPSAVTRLAAGTLALWAVRERAVPVDRAQHHREDARGRGRQHAGQEGAGSEKRRERPGSARRPRRTPRSPATARRSASHARGRPGNAASIGASTSQVDHRQRWPEHDDRPVEPPGRAPASVVDRPVRLPQEERRAVACDGGQREETGQDRIPVEDADRGSRGEVGEERQREPALGVERQAAHEVAERRAEQDRQERARSGEGRVPGRPPQGMVHVAAELDRDPAQDEHPEHEEEREVEPRETGREHAWEGHEQARRPPRAARPRSRARTARWRPAPAGAPGRFVPRTGGARRRRGRSRRARRRRSA